MKHLSLAIAILISIVSLPSQPLWNPLAVDVTRSLSKDLFESNAVPYIQPMVTAINATSNARFYSQAYIPAKVEAPYIRVSVNGMVGTISDDMKTYSPSISFGPRVNVTDVIGRHGEIRYEDGTFKYNIKPTYADTLGLTSSLFKELLRDAIDSGYFAMPPQAATLFGYIPDARAYMPNQSQLTELLRNRPEYKILDSAGKASLESLMLKLTLPEYLTLPSGVDMSSLIAGVPQIEIGALWGTELLIRFVPPVQFDKNVGKFAFWGAGLRHSISQYITDPPVDVAVQGMIQGTNLTNTVGFTQSKLEADATIMSFNIHAGKEWWNSFGVYTGFNYERIDVTSSYTYVLLQEVQIALGLLPKPPEGEVAVPTPEQPGDNQPQQSIVNAGNTNLKWTLGVSGKIGGLRLAVDYNISRFNIITAGLSYQF